MHWGTYTLGDMCWVYALGNKFSSFLYTLENTSYVVGVCVGEHFICVGEHKIFKFICVGEHNICGGDIRWVTFDMRWVT